MIPIATTAMRTAAAMKSQRLLDGAALLKPQFGHTAALLDISFLHSGHVTSIAFPQYPRPRQSDRAVEK
jgi:hypothetical protein